MSTMTEPNGPKTNSNTAKTEPRINKLIWMLHKNPELVIKSCSVPEEFDDDPNSFPPTHETLDHLLQSGRNFHATSN